MILIIDNYDSFTYNIVQTIGQFGTKIKVVRNNKISLKDIFKLKPSNIIISPGPGNPDDAGISNDVIKEFSGKIPILGVCLGHQCIGQVYGGKIVRNTPMHGKTDVIAHDGKTIYKDIANPFIATRYHSLIVDKDTLPKELEITASNKEGIIMGLRHKRFKVEGIQAHPESILTTEGKKILKNF